MQYKSIEIAVLDDEDQVHLNALVEIFDNLSTWDKDEIERATKDYCTSVGAEYKNVAQLLQVALTGRRYHVGYKTVAYILGAEEIKGRVVTLLDAPRKKK